MEKSQVKHIEESGVRWEKSPGTRAEERKEIQYKESYVSRIVGLLRWGREPSYHSMSFCHWL